ncbi:Stk1 family PASTA domain-containing Ser/Thr kinase [Virgibacillus ihumii]|uniref:Stk1 family PASTA domain-containing Ser/Thr kinase n=1 Tax=Virgibacillus ihumii TaxID=2686091 RepID=UPI00157C56F1|nr:Stk1 family PASTA domain-containing Ser/Thr kinase [Virgibacillus ihumii]
MLNGHLLNERYKIIETIGGGGMANVYLGNDIILDREVAIKVLRLEYAHDEEFIARFDREAKAATSLSHPNIVNIYDVGEEADILYMVMEYVDGMTLKEYIQRYGPINIEESLDIMKQITSAIAHAHANGIVHRDIKPQNILIDTYGQVKVTDFGIAMAMSATALTQTNSVMGSVHYLSPEQARGGMATKKSDVYSLGIVLFELLTGRLPFFGETPVSIALKHLQSDTPSVKRFNPDLPQSVENIVLKATAKDPFHRFETVYDMEDSLDTALDSDRMNEEKFSPPDEEGEETKAIPIITDTAVNSDESDETIANKPEDNTNTASFDGNDKKKTKGKKKNKGRPKRKKKWIITISILIFLLLLGAGSYYVYANYLQPQDVVIPNVAEMEYEEAVAELHELNLQTERKERYSNEIEDGNVIGTNPGADSTVKEESTVSVIVSQGKEKVTFEDYVGKDFSQIKQLLEDKYKEVISYDAYSNEPVGQIVTQIQPSPGSKVVPGETTVIFESSIGPDLISVYNLEGMTKKEAIETLNEQGLKANIIEQHSEDTPEGEVIKQDPEPYTELDEGDTVDVYISLGPEDLPPRNHTVEFKVPYEPEQEPENPKKPVEQNVKIYIGDKSHSISEVFKEDTITKDKKYSITLTIAPDSAAEYKVIRGDDIIINESVPYEEGE